MKSADESKWSTKADPQHSSPLRNRDVKCLPRPQATSGPLWLHAQVDRGTQSARHRHEAGTTPSKDDESHSKPPKEMRRRRRYRKARSAKEEGRDERKADPMTNGIFANTSSFVSALPVHPSSYYPFVVMMPLPVFPVLPMFGPSQCIYINSGNVNTTYVCDSHNNNSTSSRIKKGAVLAFVVFPSSLMCRRGISGSWERRGGREGQKA
jgi:hypothetical protein